MSPPPQMPPSAAEAAPPDGPLAADGYRVLLEAAEKLLDGVDHALTALDDGSYGTCEVCSAAIDDHDLEADPLTTRCAAHRAAAGS